MDKQLVVDVTKGLTRIAVLEEGVLTHMYLDTPLHDNVQNRIVMGQVDKVVKNLNGAFINYGAQKNGLLQLKQVPPFYQNKIQQGARIPVQIKKEHTGDKGHKLTGFLTIQGYALVCMLYEPEICLSKKIRDQETRETLKTMLEEVAGGQCGFMVRTKAMTLPIEVIRQEAHYLLEEAKQLMQIKDHVSRGTCLRQEEPLYIQVAMDHIKQEDTLVVVTNATEVEQKLEAKLGGVMGQVKRTYRTYDVYENCFKLLSIEKAFENLFKNKVWLKNGGNIVVDYTEAMTVIDVNSAKAVLTKNQQQGIRTLNELAIKESIHQILARNLSGMIVIDLVDMKTEADKREVFEYACAYSKRYDRERMTVYPLTELGLLQITRTKKYHSVKDLVGKMPSDKNKLYVQYQLEDKLRHIVCNTNQEKVYIYCCSWFYDFMMQPNHYQNLQEAYPLTIVWEKSNETTQEPFYIKYHCM